MPRCLAHIASCRKEADQLLLRYPRCLVVELSADLLEQTGICGAAKERMDNDYLDLIAGLARADGSKFWWANALSEKNELLSKFYTRLSVLYAFDRWLKDHPADDCIVVCDDGLWDPVYSLLIVDRQVSCGGRTSKRLIKTARNLFRYLIKLMLACWKEIYRMVLSRRQLKISDRLDSLREARVIKSWVDHRSYRTGSYQDAYFPDLLSYLQKHQVPSLVLADIIQDFRRRLADIVRDRQNFIVPIEYFLSLKDLWQAFIAQWVHRPQLRGRAVFGSLDVTGLVRDELDESFFSTRFFNNVLYYFKIKGLARRLDIHSFIYTFENYAWEKMCLIALKEFGHDIRTVGFQHAFIAKNSFRYLLGENEFRIVPSPGRILTMGDVTRRILGSYGRWPQNILRTGCALRQSQTMNSSQSAYARSRDILVAFTMTREDSIRILEFIYAAGLDKYPYNIILRFHPQTPVQEVLKALSFKLPSNFLISQAASLSEDLKRAGVVLYTFTTVGLEALVNGIPAVYLDVNKPLDLDPLFECQHLKERAGRPQELQAKIDQLFDLHETDYTRSLAEARRYLKDYFYPVNDDALALFAE